MFMLVLMLLAIVAGLVVIKEWLELKQWVEDTTAAAHEDAKELSAEERENFEEYLKWLESHPAYRKQAQLQIDTERGK